MYSKYARKGERENEENVKKKILYFYGGCIICFTISWETTAAAASDPFKDVISRYDEAVGHLYNAGVIKGKSNTEFGTYDSLEKRRGCSGQSCPEL